MAKHYETVVIHQDGGITTVTLNRPLKKNAMNGTMHQEMVEVLTELKRKKDLRILVITGAGDSFCAGQDLKEFFYEQKDPNEMERQADLSIEWRVRLLRLFPKPTIAAINGWCFGGAFSIVASCDLAIAAEDAIFGLSEINFDNYPGGLVSKHVGEFFRQRDGLYYALTGEPFDGKKAAEMGFVNFSVPRSELDSEVRALAEKLMAKDPVALRVTKELFKLSLTLNYEEAYRLAMAKHHELNLLQKGKWKSQGISRFLAGQYKPGLSGYQTAEKASNGGDGLSGPSNRDRRRTPKGKDVG